MASHYTFPAKLSMCPAKSNMARQIFYTISMEILWSLQKKVNAQTFPVLIISTVYVMHKMDYRKYSCTSRTCTQKQIK